MCFDHDSRPPIAPIAGGAADAQRITLTAEDGTIFSAFEARATDEAQAAFEARAADPSGSPNRTGAAILILPDVRGLHPYYEELALRFAENGIDALAIDYFGRTAGLAPRPADFDFMPHVARTRWETLAADIRVGAGRLRSTVDDGGRDRSAFANRSLFVTGFCMGGRLAFDATTLGCGFSGAIGFYGWPVGENQNGSPAPADVVDRMECPVLAIFGGADTGIKPEMREAFGAALDRAGTEHRIVTYDGAPHSFFDRKAAEFQSASEAAWAETLAFIRDHTGGRGASAVTR